MEDQPSKSPSVVFHNMISDLGQVYCTVPYCTLLYTTVHCSDHSTVHYTTLQYSTGTKLSQQNKPILLLKQITEIQLHICYKYNFKTLFENLRCGCGMRYYCTVSCTTGHEHVHGFSGQSHNRTV